VGFARAMRKGTSWGATTATGSGSGGFPRGRATGVRPSLTRLGAGSTLPRPPAGRLSLGRPTRLSGQDQLHAQARRCSCLPCRKERDDGAVGQASRPVVLGFIPTTVRGGLRAGGGGGARVATIPRALRHALLPRSRGGRRPRAQAHRPQLQSEFDVQG